MTATPNSTIDASALERLVMQVRGVVGARIVLDNHGRIDEVHAIGSPDRSAKQTVRDIESILYVRGNVRIDHRKISLVQIPESRIRAASERVRLISVANQSGEHGDQIRVELSFSDQQGTGVASAPGDTSESLELAIGNATLMAIRELTNANGDLELMHLQRQPFGPTDVCLAHITYTEDNTVDSMLGISIVRNDLPAAAARAVLDAVNRRLPYLLVG
ncbi:MAG TPA: hypothetical protein PKA05_14410 [Roseiflexaceae bacterium]|nr:hypothetical protein [Roseiflexaceae bacterium]HMP41569.1 hypothetical protein [Roseiflexaceae bacterium]